MILEACFEGDNSCNVMVTIVSFCITAQKHHASGIEVVRQESAGNLPLR